MRRYLYLRRAVRVATVFLPLVLGCSARPDSRNGDLPETTATVKAAGAQLAPLAPVGASDVASIQAYIDSLYSPKDVRHTFTTKFNEVIDCVDFQAQPSVKALAKQGITALDEGPPTPPPSAPGLPAIDPSIALSGQPDQNGSARNCPSGSVPYPRVTVARIQAAGGLTAYLHAPDVMPHPPAGPICSPFTSENGLAWAEAGNTSLNNLGATTIAAVYDPGMQVLTNCGNFGQPVCEHSISQLWINTGTCEALNGNSCASGTAIQSVELGWMVQSHINGDTNPHIFAFSTQNGYAGGSGSGCYNLTCSEFVQVTNPAYFPGQTIGGIVPPSVGKAPVEIAFQVFNPGVSYPAAYHNWYVYVNGSLIGYYPGTLFSGQMVTQASSMAVGGEVATNYVDQPYADVLMGSGFPANDGFTMSAYHRDIYYLNPGTGSGSICGSPFCSNGFCYTDPRSAWSLGVCGFDAASYGYTISTTTPTGGSNSSCWGPYFYYGGGL